MWTCTDPWRIWNPFCNVSSPCCCYPCFQDLLWFFHVFFFFSSSTIILVYPCKITARALSLHFVRAARVSSSSSVIEQTNEISQLDERVNHRWKDARGAFVLDGWSRERCVGFCFFAHHKIRAQDGLCFFREKKESYSSDSRLWDINTGFIEWISSSKKSSVHHDRPLSFNL